MRSSGILLHITSLPGPYGIGTMGEQAYAFVDFLKSAGQSCWQILPLTPTGYGDSPYQSCSAFAGNPYLIDLDALVKAQLLTEEDLEWILWCRREDRVDFGMLYNNRMKILRLAFDRFCHRGGDKGEDFRTFLRGNVSWLRDYAFFMALKEFHGGKPWYQWSDAVKFRRPNQLFKAERDLEKDILFYCFVQYLFYQQWDALHAYANEKGIKIIGDVPIYVPLDSVEVWCRPELFQLDKKLEPVAVAGCPPDAFTEDGQLWGNPLYNWEAMACDGYQWWTDRLAAAGKLYDVVRLDHFRGFEAYWSVPCGDPTARYGKWVKGPGRKLIRTLKEKLPSLEMIAEDLGYLTQEVQDLRQESGYPGMKVLQFAFDSREPSDYLPHTYIPNTVCYTGTHDNMTMGQWFETASPEAVAYAREYMRLSGEEGYVWGAIRTALASVSDMCIIQMQDYLNLGGEARMNFPGTQSGANWTWRMAQDALTGPLAERIRKLTALYARIP